MEMNNYVFYHKDCLDGVTCAWVIKTFYKTNIIINSLSIDDVPEYEFMDFMEKNVYFVDVCPPLEYLMPLCNFAKKVVIIDHNISNKKLLDNIQLKPPNMEIIFDENSSCVITWKYFFGNNVDIPWFLHYIEDSDLWNRQQPHSVEVIKKFSELYNNINNSENILCEITEEI